MKIWPFALIGGIALLAVTRRNRIRRRFRRRFVRNV
jgi:hypothetical protein